MNLIAALLVMAGTATAQTPAPSPQPQTQKKPLNLKLDENAARSQPRINFEGRDEKATASNLPALGGSGMSFDKPPARSSESASTPFPKDSNPNIR